MENFHLKEEKLPPKALVCPEMVVHIFRYLDPPALLNVSQISQQWHLLAQESLKRRLVKLPAPEPHKYVGWDPEFSHLSISLCDLDLRESRLQLLDQEPERPTLPPTSFEDPLTLYHIRSSNAESRFPLLLVLVDCDWFVRVQKLAVKLTVRDWVNLHRFFLWKLENLGTLVLELIWGAGVQVPNSEAFLVPEHLCNFSLRNVNMKVRPVPNALLQDPEESNHYGLLEFGTICFSLTEVELVYWRSQTEGCLFQLHRLGKWYPWSRVIKLPVVHLP